MERHDSTEQQDQLLWRGFETFLERAAPWLFDLGAWTFGSLIAFNILILASLLTIGPVDRAVRVATAALASTLPLNVAALFLLKLAGDVKHGRFEDELARSLLEVGYTGRGRVAAPHDLADLRRRRAKTVLRIAPVVLVVSVILTLVGVVATLSHMGWWIALSFVAMIAVSLLIVVVTMAAAQARSRHESANMATRPHHDAVHE